MTSAARIAANRRNAQHSTGPKSEQGRAVASRNALRHGLTAKEMVIDNESAAAFARLHAEISAALAPADAFEEILAERILLGAWLLRRAARVEVDLMETAMNRDFSDGGRLSAAFAHRGMEMTVLSRYEAAIERALHHAHMTLERRQARRRGEAVPAPLAVQVDIAGEASPIVKFDETNPTNPLESLDSP